MKQTLSLGLIWLCFTSFILGLNYSLEDFNKKNSNINVGYVNINSNTYFKTAINPNLNYKGLELGLGLNLYVPLGKYKTPKSADWITLHHVAYDYKNTHGFKLGHLRGLTLGGGLLVDNFDSGSGGSNEPKLDKMGILAYSTLYNTKFTGLYTFQNIKALRIARPVVSIAKIPLIIGGTIIQDADGINDTTTSQTVLREKQSAYAADVSFPIGGEFLTLYSEYASLENQGNGFSAGFRGDILTVFAYKAEYRNLQKGFAPGYFNSTYQSTSFSFPDDALQKDTSGFLINASTGFLDNYIKAGVQYEKYEDINVLTASAGWKQIGPMTGVVNVSKPFNATHKNTVVIADINYKTGKFYDLIFRVKRTYTSVNDYEESTAVGVQFNSSNLNSLLPF